MPSERRDSLELITKWAVRPDDLLEYLNEFRPHVVHFSGHGTDQQQIVLVNDSRVAIPVSAWALRQLFTTCKDNIRVVVLNACFPREQAEAIVAVIDCAIGMKQEIGDDAAIAFAASFYSAVGFGRSVLDAFEQSKVALLLKGIPEEDTPTLLVRAGVDPKRVFLVDSETEEPSGHSQPPPNQAPPAGSARPAMPVPANPGAPSLLTILPGMWQVRIQMGWALGQMALEIWANHQFRGEPSGQMGSGIAEGQWAVDPATGQIALQGRLSNGFQVQPYAVLIQATYFDQQQIVGVTSANEQVTWQRLR
ncbi:MAG: CHAT domain-containing protein [Caldimonas sp.]